jgi:uncharacterized membrane protein
MEELLKRFAEHVGLALDLTAGILIAFGAMEAIYGILKFLFFGAPNTGRRKKVWLRFAGWLMLGLEFELAADIVLTAISPTWSDIGQLGSIAVIRTFLNYFLEKDLEDFGDPPEPQTASAQEPQAQLLSRAASAGGASHPRCCSV